MAVWEGVFQKLFRFPPNGEKVGQERWKEQKYSKIKTIISRGFSVAEFVLRFPAVDVLFISILEASTIASSS